MSTPAALGWLFALIATVIALDWLAVLLVRAEERGKRQAEEAKRRAAARPAGEHTAGEGR